MDAHDNPDSSARRPASPPRGSLCAEATHRSFAPLLAALDFAACKHRNHHRKDATASPYVNHLIAVTRILVDEGGVDDEPLLLAAVLHDSVEDTETTVEELAPRFGSPVAELVREVTDDKSLERQERRRQPIERARHASPRARQIKIVDKIANLRDILETPPAAWTCERKLDYVEWAGQVVDACRHVNPRLGAAFDALALEARGRLGR